MIFEDDKEYSSFMATALQKQGYETLVVHDSSQTIPQAESAIPHLFLIDLLISPPDGFKLCRMLRGHPNFKQSPILIMTTLDNTDSKIIAIGAGANNYLVKPFSEEDLITKVKETLGS